MEEGIIPELSQVEFALDLPSYALGKYVILVTSIKIIHKRWKERIAKVIV